MASSPLPSEFGKQSGKSFWGFVTSARKIPAGFGATNQRLCPMPDIEEEGHNCSQSTC
jgi:hypothetical protein